MFPVGRLDKDTEGLLLITDDGALAHELLSPKKHVDKTYYAVTDGCVTKEDVQRFAEGLEIGEKNPTMPAKLEILRTRKVEETELEQYPSGWYAGAGTRSEVKKFIQKGKVQVNGVPAKKSEIKVSEEDEVVLDGNRISQAPEFVYYLLHKPAGYVSATEDKRDKTVMELVASDRKGLFPVGRLDKDTEGLLLITDDGALAHELLSPKKHVDKTYYAVTDGCMTKEDVQRFADGLEIGEKNPTMPAKLEILSTRKVEETELEQYPSGWSSEIQLTIKEGKFHQVKRMTEAVGKKVVYLKRISMGVLTLPDDLKKGECRQLTAEEEKRLKESVVIK